MELEQLLQLVANTGFPIVVAGFLMVRMEEKLDQLTRVLQELKGSIEQMMV